MGVLVVLVSGVAAVAAVYLVASSAVDADCHVARRAVAWDRERTVRLSWSLVTGGLVVLASGWLLPAVALGWGSWWIVGSWQRRRHGLADDVARIDALASWIENLRDVLLAGDQPVGAIARTVPTAPAVIRPAVRRLAAGLGRQEPDVVFRRFADDLDDPLGDLVAAGLMIAVRRGARTSAVLSSLAEQARHQADRRRLVEAERAPTRREVSALVTIMGAFVLALFAFGRSDYLAAYDTVGGQVVLSLALVAHAALVIRVQRLARFPRPSRFLTLRGGVG